MKAVLGLDIGTTAAKALVVTLDGDVLGGGHYVYDDMLRIGEAGYEQNPEEFWKGLVVSCRQALAQVNPDISILALCLSTQAGTTIPLDKENKPLRNAISWMDHRGQPYMDELFLKHSLESFYLKSGWMLSAGSALLHIYRLFREEPDVFDKTHRFAFVNDFLIQCLTGKFYMDPSNAGITSMYNIRQGNWDEEILRLVNVDKSKFSEIRESATPIGTLTKEAAAVLGLSKDTLVINGAHDQYCAAMGTGVCSEGDMLVATGTAWVMLTVHSNAEQAYNTGWSVSSHPISGLYGALISAGAVGKGMSWFIDNVLSVKKPENIDQWIDAALKKSPVGANGLIFISPAVAQREGTVSGFVNLDIDHTLEDMIRAIMECTVYEIKRLRISTLASDAANDGANNSTLNVSSRVIMSGRPAENKAWAQMLSDVLELPLVVPGIREAASFGAAILAGIGAGTLNQANWPVITQEALRYEPDCEVQKYRQGYAQYVEALKRCGGGISYEKTT